MTITDHHSFCWGPRKEDNERSTPPDERGGHVAAHALDESQDKTCARVSLLMHLTDPLGWLPERLLQDGKMEGRADPPVETTPRMHHTAGAHPPDCTKSPAATTVTCKGKTANGETFCGALKRGTKKLNRPSQTHTELLLS